MVAQELIPIYLLALHPLGVGCFWVLFYVFWLGRLERNKKLVDATLLVRQTVIAMYIPVAGIYIAIFSRMLICVAWG